MELYYFKITIENGGSKISGNASYRMTELTLGNIEDVKRRYCANAETSLGTPVPVKNCTVDFVTKLDC